MIHGDDVSSEAVSGWRAKAALLASGLFISIGLFGIGVVLPQIGKEFATTPNAELFVQLLGAVASFAFAIGSPIAGAIIGRIGCRNVLIPSLILFVIAGLLPMALHDLWSLLVTRFFIGLSIGSIFTAGLTGISTFPEQQRAKMFGWYSVVGGAAAILLFPLVAQLASYGWRLSFLVNVVGLLVLPLALLLPRRIGIATTTHAHARPGVPLLNGAMLRLLGIGALTGMGMFLGPMYSPLYLASEGVTDPRLLAIPITLGSVAAVFASSLYGFAHRRLGLDGVTALTMLTWGGGLLIAGLAGGMLPLFTLGVVLSSGTIGMIAPHVSASAIHRSDPANTARALGLANGIMFGAQLLFPFIAGWIRGQTSLSGVFIAFALAGITIGIATIVTTMASRKAAPQT